MLSQIIDNQNKLLLEKEQKIKVLKKELKSEKEYSATLRKEIDEYTNSHTLCVKYKELQKACDETQEQLTKTKEIIRQFLNDYPVITKELLDKLEQFIKEIKEK